MIELRDDFDDPDLDESVWFPYYLPAWSSRALTRAAYRIADSRLTLFIPSDRGLWCPDEHPEPIRVSGIQSGSYSGRAGTRAGQQRFREDLVVREPQPRFEGWLPSGGTVEIRCRMQLSIRSMAAMWLAGFEEHPDDSGEICIVEVFGRGLQDRSAMVGVGVKKLHDPRLVHDFVTPRIEIDVSELHTYAVTWSDRAADFFVDDTLVHSCASPPTYPMQAMLAVFDFPDWSTGDDDHLEPSLDIDWVAGSPASPRLRAARKPATANSEPVDVTAAQRTVERAPRASARPAGRPSFGPAPAGPTLAQVATNRARRTRAARRRRHRMNRVEHDLTDEQWHALQAEWDGCAYCGVSGTKLQRDCVKPISRGGRYTLDNVVPACGPCNTSKWSHEVTSWLRRRRLDEPAFLLRHVAIGRELARRFAGGQGVTLTERAVLERGPYRFRTGQTR